MSDVKEGYTVDFGECTVLKKSACLRANGWGYFDLIVDGEVCAMLFEDNVIDAIGDVCNELGIEEFEPPGYTPPPAEALRCFARAVEAIALCALIREEGIRDAFDLMGQESDWLIRRPLPPRGEGGAG